MKELAPGLWTITQPLRFLTLEIGTRMTIVRLSDESLWLHSPIEPSAEHVGAVKALGRISCIVAPNRFHHLYAGAWLAHAEGAALYGAPRLPAKRKDLHFDHVLGDAPEARWADDLDQVWLQGFPLAEEIVFLHRASRTLIASDIGFNLSAHPSRLTRLLIGMAGSRAPLEPTLLERFGIRDRVAFRSALDRVLAWDFDRAIVAHGDIVESDARRTLERAYRFLIQGEAS